MQLSEEQIARYAHHIIHKDIGGEGQKRLLTSKVLIVGVGGLGSPSALYLAAAGVGTLGIIDGDRVEISNLQRQIIHFSDDIGKDKIISAKEKIVALNPDVKVITYGERLDENNIESIIGKYDFVIDGSDNFPTKFLINDACVKMNKPYSHAGVTGFKGQTFTYVSGSPCLRCLFRDPPPPDCIQDCRGTGILGAAAGILGTIQSAEAIKFLLKKEGLVTCRVLYVDTLVMKFHEIKFKCDKNCPACGVEASTKV